MRVLVTGGAGFIGSHIVDALQARDHDVTVLDQHRGKSESGDWLMLHDIRAPLDGPGPFDAICHQAAQPSLRASIDDPAYDAMVNIIGTINVIQAARECGAHVVFASTSAVYDPAGGTFTEESPVMPNLPYGIAKATAEQYLRHSGVSHTILRYGNVYGPRQVPVGENQLIPHVLGHILDHKPFAINGDGQQTRDFVYVEDVAGANVIAIETQIQGTYNIGSGIATPVWEVCEQLAWLCDWRGKWQIGPAKPGEARHVTLDSTKAAQDLDWSAQIPLVEGLTRTVEAWKKR